MVMRIGKSWGLAVLLCLGGSLALNAADGVDPRSKEPQQNIGTKHVMSGIVCNSEAALDAAFEILGKLEPDAYHHFSTLEMDCETVDRMRPDGCDTGTVDGYVRVKTTRSLQGETVLIFEIKGRVEYWASDGAATGTFYSWLGSGR